MDLTEHGRPGRHIRQREDTGRAGKAERT